MNARIWMLPQGVLALVFLLSANAALNGASYDWDIDHMMYFGGRLLQGDLAWTREFDDKLPLVQMLFAVPAAVGSVHAWQVLSIASVLAAAFALWLALRRILVNDWDMTPQAARPVALAGATLYLYLAAALPGSLSHINPMAASLLVLATLLLLARRPGRRGLVLAVPGTVFAPACLAAIAVSLRPYLLAPAMLAGLWPVVRHDTERSHGMPATLIDFSLWVLVLGVTGLAMNFAPYLVTGQATAVIDGLSLLGQQLNPQSLVDNVSMQVRALYFGNDLAAFIGLAWFAFFAWILLALMRRQRKLLTKRAIRVDLLFAVVLSPLALELMILNKHFWPHYQQLFIPYAAVSVAFMLALGAMAHPARAAGVTHLLLLGAFLVFVRIDVSRSAASAMRAASTAHPWEADRLVVKRFLQQRGARGASFLNPSHMYLHWTLGQPRHGFPHAANTLQISQGWWARVRKPRSLDLPVTRQEYCERLEQRGPRFIIDRPDYWVMSCLTANPASHYARAALLDTGSGSRLAIFERVR